jgi:putative RecB family exonuclease
VKENPPTLAQLRKTPHWSCSSIGTFMTCSLAWAFQYVYQLDRGPTPAALVFGGCFHRALGFLFRKTSVGESIAREAILDLFGDLLLQESKLSEREILYDDGDDLNSLTAKGRDMLEAYIKDLDPEERVLGVDVAFSVPLEDADGNALSKPLIGEFDAVVAAPTGVEIIVDWKTARARYAAPYVAHHLQPTCYLYAHRKLGGRDDTGFRFDVVTKTKTPVVQKCPTERDPDSSSRLVELVRMIEKAARHECFIPNDQSWRCKGCEYSSACEAWHRDRSRSFHRLELVA